MLFLHKKKIPEVFKEFDKNKDGSLSKKEFEAGIQKIMNGTVHPTQLKDLWDKCDKNALGRVEIDAFKNRFELSVRMEKRYIQKFQISALDFSDFDGVKEVLSMVFRKAEGSREKMFEFFDQNGDGKCSRKEFVDTVQSIADEIDETEYENKFNVQDAFKLFDLIDESGHEVINIREFIKLLLVADINEETKVERKKIQYHVEVDLKLKHATHCIPKLAEKLMEKNVGQFIRMVDLIPFAEQKLYETLRKGREDRLKCIRHNDKNNSHGYPGYLEMHLTRVVDCVRSPANVEAKGDENKKDSPVGGGMFSTHSGGAREPKLSVTVTQGEGLTRHCGSPAEDPYVVIRSLDGAGKTLKELKSGHVHSNEKGISSFEYTDDGLFVPGVEEIEFRVMDVDQSNSDVPLGVAKVKVKQLIGSEETLVLMKGDKESGKLTVSGMFSDGTEKETVTDNWHYNFYLIYSVTLERPKQYIFTIYLAKMTVNENLDVVAFDSDTWQSQRNHEVVFEQKKVKWIDWPENGVRCEDYLEVTINGKTKQYLDKFTGEAYAHKLADDFIKKKANVTANHNHVSFPAFTVVDLVRQFQRLDKDKNGQLTKAELVTGIAHVGRNEKQAASMASSFFELCDKDQDGTVDFREFVAEYVRMQEFTALRTLTALFHQRDADDGAEHSRQNITKKELYDLLEKLMGEETAKDRIDLMFRSIDLDRSGDISLKELAVWYFAFQTKLRVQQRLKQYQNREQQEKDDYETRRRRGSTF